MSSIRYRNARKKHRRACKDFSENEGGQLPLLPLLRRVVRLPWTLHAPWRNVLKGERDGVARRHSLFLSTFTTSPRPTSPSQLPGSRPARAIPPLDMPRPVEDSPSVDDIHFDQSKLEASASAERGELYLLNWLSGCEKALAKLPEVRIASPFSSKDKTREREVGCQFDETALGTALRRT